MGNCFVFVSAPLHSVGINQGPACQDSNRLDGHLTALQKLVGISICTTCYTSIAQGMSDCPKMATVSE